MNIILLGGTRDALEIAKSIIGRGHSVLYSVAGLVGKPRLKCPVRVGGFGGPQGMIEQLAANHIDCLVDATHPYARKISRHAVIAATALSIPILRYTRPKWRPVDGDNWKTVADDWSAIVAATMSYRRPFLTIGRKPLLHMDEVPTHQQWLIRTLTAANDANNPKAHVLQSRGPFDRNSERALMLLNGVDVLVSKNSGGRSITAKIEVARELKIPVLMLRRPKLAPVENEFSSPDSLVTALPSHA